MRAKYESVIVQNRAIFFQDIRRDGAKAGREITLRAGAAVTAISRAIIL